MKQFHHLYMFMNENDWSFCGNLIKSGKYLFVQQNSDIFQIITRIFKRYETWIWENSFQKRFCLESHFFRWKLNNMTYFIFSNVCMSAITSVKIKYSVFQEYMSWQWFRRKCQTGNRSVVQTRGGHELQCLWGPMVVWVTPPVCVIERSIGHVDHDVMSSVLWTVK